MTIEQQKKINVNVYDTSGAVVATRDLPTEIFGVPVKEGVLHLALVAQRASARTILASTKTRGEVRGGGRKPWKQKGTGRARHGSIRSPIWRGGGVVFGPRSSRVFAVKINKKVKKKAVCMLLSQRVADGRFILLNALKFEKPKTKDAIALLKKLPLELEATRKRRAPVGIICPTGDRACARSFRNIPAVTITNAQSLNITSLLKSAYIILPLASIAEIEKTYLPSS